MLVRNPSSVSILGQVMFPSVLHHVMEDLLFAFHEPLIHDTAIMIQMDRKSFNVEGLPYVQRVDVFVTCVVCRDVYLN
jgi:hypothetical protein